MDRRAEALGPTGDRVSRRLRQLRQDRGYTLQQVAERLRELGRPILLSALSKIEKGQRRVDADDLVALALALDVAPNTILLHPADAVEEVSLAPAVVLDTAAAWEWATRLQATEITHADFADLLRARVAALHGEIRLPHVGARRSVPDDELYVEPQVRDEHGTLGPVNLSTLLSPGGRTVIFGGPGSGKSTLVGKIAHDVASDRIPGCEGMIPFPLVLRDYAWALREGDQGLAHFLEQACRTRYNVSPPGGMIDGLLLEGKCVVIADGLDEVIDPEMRSRLVELLHSFARRYPAAPLVVTSRPVGYNSAPLDSDLFSALTLAALGIDDVKKYVARWFALDSFLGPEEQGRLAASFLAESEDLMDLRTNPLTLSLLCEMYGNEGYIPRNRSEVYEKTASLLFDRWDTMRGIAVPLRFQGRVRGAVQYLAWHILNSPGSGQYLPRRRLLIVLTEYLEQRRWNQDEAMEFADQFLEFCTGRAWILTDVGSRSNEPIYGFSHRTFLEFFAAEYLVRTYHSPEGLWNILGPHLASGDWDSVAQIAVHLFDRSFEDGGQILLGLVVTGNSYTGIQKRNIQEFAIRALSELSVPPKVASAIQAFASNEEPISD